MAHRIDLRTLGAADGLVLVYDPDTGAVGMEGAATGAAVTMTSAAQRVATLTPVNAAAASVDIGSGTDGTVTITAGVLGTAGNAYTAEVEVATGNDQSLAAAIVAGAVTVTLGTDGAGDPDDTKNTATLVAAAVDALTGVSAAASGTGATPLTAAEAEASFTGGTNGTTGAAGQIAYDDTYLYVCTATNGATGQAWRRVVLGSAY